MKLSYPVPTNEAQRLQIINQLRLLDTLPEPQFDALVRTAARMFHVPTSLFSLVAADRQWFKARVGFDLQETMREHAFCSHAVANGQMLVVEDATLDPRFSSNPFVQAENGIRFYAGIPLTLGDGHHLGTLCIIDSKPRTFSETDRSALGDLADVANSHLVRQAKDILAESLSRRGDVQKELLRRQENDLQAQKRILDQAARFAKLGGFEVDLENGELRWTEGMFAIHGMDPGAPPSYGDHYDMYDEADRDAIKEVIARARARKDTFDVEARATTPDGRRRWFRIAGGYSHQAGQPPTWCGMKQDITEQKRLQRRIEFLAEHDPITRLANRTKLQSTLDKRFELSGALVGLILVDLDNFKRINDTHGHPVGDACLRAVARRIRHAARGSQLVARTGGDEFAVIPADGKSMSALARVADRLLENLRTPVECDGLSFHIGGSVGIAAGTAGSATELLRQADLALYASKAAGRGTWRSYTPELDQAAREKYRQISAIAAAIERDEIEVFYQPKVDLATRQHIGFEALVRWRQPDGQVAAPGSFAAALEDALVSARLGDVVFDKVVRQATEWRRKHFQMGHIAINLSYSQMADPDLVQRIISRLDSQGLPRSVLEVEITEDVLLAKDPDQIGRVLRQFRSNGIKVALDDFGTGYASLTHLRQFRVDALKIDRSFVSRLGRVAEDTLIVQAIVGLAHSLGIDVVAEGIETEAQLDFLKALRCEFGQGYLFAKPQPASQFEAGIDASGRAIVA